MSESAITSRLLKSLLVRSAPFLRYIRVDTCAVPFCVVHVYRVQPGEYSIRVIPRSDAWQKSETGSGALVIETDHPRLSRFEIPVTLQSIGEIVALPAALLVPARKGEQAAPLEGSVLLRSQRGRPFEVIAMEPPTASVDVQTTRRGETEYLLAVCHLRPADARAQAPVRVRIQRADGREEILDIPVRLDSETVP